jgi:hypothetical protein
LRGLFNAADIGRFGCRSGPCDPVEIFFSALVDRKGAHRSALKSMPLK